MSRQSALELQRRVTKEGALAVCGALLDKTAIAACPSRVAYAEYKALVGTIFGVEDDAVYIAGSGNWGFSLNPAKNYRGYCEQSDIDLCVVSEESFDAVWNSIRELQRSRPHAIDRWQREKQRRNSEAIYAGFVTPRWIQALESPLRVEHEFRLNQASSKHVAYKRVAMFFFKNREDMVDYHARALIALQKSSL